jgi:hypothetical protein
MKKKIEEILDKLIAEMQKGRVIDDCLREYPEDADELRSLLELCQQIDALPGPKPDNDKVAATVRQARKLQTEKQRSRGFSVRDIFALRPMVVRVTAVILLVVLAVTTTVTLSASSLPGDALYSVKLLAERVQYFLTFDTEGKARLHVMFADRRTNELACLVEPGLPVDRGLLTSMLNETRLAIDHIELLSADDAALLVERVDKCNKMQLTLLEDTKKRACDHDQEALEDAIMRCKEQHECIRCMQNQGSSNDIHCPCDGAQTIAD